MGFFKIDEILLKFWVSFEDLILKTSCIALHLHYNKYYHAFRCVQSLCVLIGLDWAEPMMYLLCMSYVHAFSMHLYVFSHILIIVNYFGAFLIVSFFSLFILFALVVSMAPKRKSISARNPLHSDASSFFDHFADTDLPTVSHNRE